MDANNDNDDMALDAEDLETHIQNCIHRDGNVMMAAFGFKRLSNGNWNDDELHWLFDQIDEHGVVWVYEQIDKSGLSAAVVAR